MINKPFHKLSADERAKFDKEKVYVTPFPNRASRREFDNNKNLVRQEIELKDSKGNVTGKRTVYHRKPTNVPYQYLGIAAMKGSQAHKRMLEKKVAP